MLLHAGPEIAVASTKAYVAQVAVLALAAYVTAKANGKGLEFDLKQELKRLPLMASKQLLIQKMC